MYLIRCADSPNRAERAMIAALDPVPGVLLSNLLLPGRRTLDVDGVAITPDGVVTLEAKGTGQAGQLACAANGPWTIGGAVADFPSGPNPTAQARRQAQVSAGLLKGAGVRLPRLGALVVVAGDQVELRGGATEVVADVVATTPQALARTLTARLASAAVPFTRQRPGPPVSVADVAAICIALGVPADRCPPREALLRQGFLDRPQETPRAAPQPTRPSWRGPRYSTTSAPMDPARRRAISRVLAGVALVCLLASVVVFRLTRPAYDARPALEALTAGVARLCGSTPGRLTGDGMAQGMEHMVPCHGTVMVPDADYRRVFAGAGLPAPYQRGITGAELSTAIGRLDGNWYVEVTRYRTAVRVDAFVGQN